MYLINNQLFYSLEEHLDMASFDSINDTICKALARNWQHFRPSGTSQNTIYDKTKLSIFEKKNNVLKNNVENFDHTQALFYAKLTGTVTLGTNFTLRGTKGYPETYSKKHKLESALITSFDHEFQFLYDWINAQGCFDEYGRVIFWINEPCQKTAFHHDYPLSVNPKKRDPFIWLTGIIPKRLVLLDPDTQELHYSNTRACVFDTNNIHSSVGHDYHVAWSLRIDGTFNKEWATRAGIWNHFNQ